MNNAVIIGYYHIPGHYTSTVYTQDMKTYEKTIYEVPAEDLGDHIEKLKRRYPNYQTCEFRY